MKDLLFVGIRGSMVALDRTTGSERWRTRLKGQGTVLFSVEDTAVYATANGECWCLDAVTGAVLWHNPLRGLGLGLATVGAVRVGPEQTAAIAEHRRRASQAAAASAGS